MGGLLAFLSSLKIVGYEITTKAVIHVNNTLLPTLGLRQTKFISTKYACEVIDFSQSPNHLNMVIKNKYRFLALWMYFHVNVHIKLGIKFRILFAS